MLNVLVSNTPNVAKRNKVNSIVEIFPNPFLLYPCENFSTFLLTLAFSYAIQHYLSACYFHTVTKTISLCVVDTRKLIAL